MRIVLEYAAQFKVAAGIESEAVTLDAPCTVEQCIRILAERHGDPLCGLLLRSDGSVHPSTLAFVGDRQVRWSEPRALCDGDVITLLSPISGG